MEQDELIKKWLSDELSQAEAKEFKDLEDYSLNKEILEGAQQFKAPEFSTAENFEALKSKLNTSKKLQYS